MEPLEYLRTIRERYLEQYRRAIRTKRAEGLECTPEVWVQPNVPAGEQGPPHPLCVDIMVRKEDRPETIMVTVEASSEGPQIGLIQVANVEVKLYETHWEACPIWMRHVDPNWSLLEPWRHRWMDVDRNGNADEDGLCGVVHYIGRPIAEGGGFLYEMDFGSAPVEAIVELLQTLVQIGASEIELGRSDGSDLPTDVQIELRQPDLSLERLAALTARLVAALDHVERVEIVANDELAIYPKDDRDIQRIYLGNLHRLLQRVGVEARAREVYRFLRSQRELAAPQNPPDLSQLRPVIKDDRFMQNIRQLSPKMKALVAQRLTADLWVVCVWDAPNGMRFVTADEPQRYGMSAAQVLTRARTNYLESHRSVDVSEYGRLLVARTGDCYDATLLLDDTWWDETAVKVKGEVLACVPARHLVLIGGASRVGMLHEMRKAAQRIEEGGDHLITQTILVRRYGIWEKFEPDIVSLTKRRPWWQFW